MQAQSRCWPLRPTGWRRVVDTAACHRPNCCDIVIYQHTPGAAQAPDNAGRDGGTPAKGAATLQHMSSGRRCSPGAQTVLVGDGGVHPALRQSSSLALLAPAELAAGGHRRPKALTAQKPAGGRTRRDGITTVTPERSSTIPLLMATAIRIQPRLLRCPSHSGEPGRAVSRAVRGRGSLSRRGGRDRRGRARRGARP